MRFIVGIFKFVTKAIRKETKHAWGEYETTITDRLTKRFQKYETDTESGAAYRAMLFLAEHTDKESGKQITFTRFGNEEEEESEAK